jgi:hypothetical protein
MFTKLFARVLPLLLFAALNGCSSSPPPPPPVFAPLDYSYLPPIRLNISNITIQNDYVPDPSAATLIGQDPEAPANALMDMLPHRLVADGTPGNGTVTIENASIEPVGDNYVGVMTVRLDVVSADGLKTGYTEASVSVTNTAPGSDASADDVKTALYNMTKQLMDSMNVQLQYQIQRNMGSWISYGTNAAVPAVNGGNSGIQAAPLTAPGAATPAAPAAAMPVPAAPAAGSLAPGALAPGVGTLGTLPITAPPPPQ